MKLLPGTAPGSSIVKVKTTRIGAANISPRKGKVLEAKVKIIEINKILKGSLAAEKKQESDKNKKEQADKRNKREKKLETTKEEKKAAPKLPLPKVPFFDRIKNFIVNTALGFVLTRLVDETGAIKPIIPFIASTFDFIVDFAIGTLDNVGGFLEKSYEFIDSTRQFAEDRFGQEGLKKFDNFLGAVRNLFNAALIVAAINQRTRPGRTDKPRKPSGPGRTGGGTSRPPTAAERVRSSRIRNVQRRFGPGARQIYENALNNGKTPSQAQAAVNRALKRGQITARPGASSLASRTAPRGSILKGGLRKAPGRLGTKLLGKAGVKFVKGIFGRIPILGPIVVAVASLLAGEPPGQALFKGLGAALGGLLGSFIPIPIVGTLLGETIGVFVGDLLYELIRPGGGPDKAGAKFMSAMNGIIEGGKAVGEWIASGSKRYIKGFLKEYPLKLPEGGGVREAATSAAKALGMYDFLKSVGYAGGSKQLFGDDKQIDKFPNILQLLNPFATIPLLIKSFFPPAKNPPKESDEGFNLSKFFFGSDYQEGANQSPEGLGRLNVGAVSGQGIVNIGKDLASKGFAVAEHPDFTKDTSGGRFTPGQGYVSDVHRGKGHYDGRALDVTDFRGSLEDSKARYRSVLDSLYQQRDKLNINMLIHDSWGDYYYPNASKGGPSSLGHPTHMHIETRDKGGMIGRGLFRNKSGKPEMVLDADTTKALEDNVPGFLDALNKADYSGALSVLRNYAGYETGGVQFIPVPIPMKDSKSQSPAGRGSSLRMSTMSAGEDWNQILYANG